MGAKLKRKQQLNAERQRRYRERQKAAQALANVGDDDPITVTPPAASPVTPVEEVLQRYAWVFDGIPPHQALETLLALTARLRSNDPEVKIKAYHAIGVGFGIVNPKKQLNEFAAAISMDVVPPQPHPNGFAAPVPEPIPQPSQRDLIIAALTKGL